MYYLLEILKLDSALEILYLNKDKAALTQKEMQSKLSFRFSEEEIAMLIDKIRKDSLLTEIVKNTISKYYLTYEGAKFYQNGGFLKAAVRNFFKKAIKTFIVALGVISTLIGIALGVRELF